MIRTYLSRSHNVINKVSISSSLFPLQQQKSNVVIWRRNNITQNNKSKKNPSLPTKTDSVINESSSFSMKQIIPAFGIGTLAGICGSLGKFFVQSFFFHFDYFASPILFIEQTKMSP